ncbi:MAG: hypothetical protein HUK15_10235, partial [Bacteroidales bacterium]|nr:hypothetical protein [Bacteroidales bacterium]
CSKTASSANDWLISPGLHIDPTSPQKIHFDYRTSCFYEGIIENLDLYILNSPNDIENATLAESFSISGEGSISYNIPSEYADQVVYFGIKHSSTHEYYSQVYIDNFAFKYASTPEIYVSPESLSFNTIGTNRHTDQRVQINAFDISGDISVTASGPFVCSADGENFGSQISIPNTTEELIIRYMPTEAGTHQSVITLSYEDAMAQVIATGKAIDCNPIKTSDFYDFTYYESFYSQNYIPCWTIVDANEDGNTFVFNSGSVTYSSSASTLTGDDWIISPALQIDENKRQKITFRGEKYPTTGVAESYECYILTDIYELSNGNLVTSQSITSDFNYEFEIPHEYAGQIAYIGFRCTSPRNASRFSLRNFSFADIVPTIYYDWYNIDAMSSQVGVPTYDSLGFSTEFFTEDVNVSSEPPLYISTDNVNFSNNITMPSEGGTFYVKFDPQTEYSAYMSYIVLSNSNATDSVGLSLYAIDCSVALHSGYNTGFDNSEDPTVNCWSTIDANNDGYTFEINPGARHNNPEGTTANDWLISPLLHVDDTVIDKIEYEFGYNPTTSNRQTYEIYILTSKDDIENAVRIVEETE